MELTVQIVGVDLAHVDFGERCEGSGRSRFFLGIQKGEEVMDLVPVTDASATFTARFDVSPLPGGGTNFLGPYAHGTRAARFCYLCWVSQDDAGNMNMFSRIKLHLSSLGWARVEASAHAGKPVVMRFSLLGRRGGPICASVPEDAVRWDYC